MSVLERLQETHCMPRDLYISIRRNIENNYIENQTQNSAFVRDLPLDLRRPLSLLIYDEFIRNFDFLQDKTIHFTSWICPILKPLVCGPREIIIHENDEAEKVFFLRRNKCYYVLPKYAFTPYIVIEESTSFGFEDFLASMVQNEHKIVSNTLDLSPQAPDKCDSRGSSRFENSRVDEDESQEQQIFEGVRRRFCVQAGEEDYTELLTMDKT